MPVIGFIVGILVAFTSVGSGSLIITSLLLLFPEERLKGLIGSDVFHGVLLVGVAAIGHWHFGDVNIRLVSGLLIGSLPGVWLGSLLAGRVPERVTRAHRQDQRAHSLPYLHALPLRIVAIAASVAVFSRGRTHPER